MSILFDNPYEEERPWGKFSKFTENEPSTVKILTVDPGEAFSLQHHNHRSKFWVIMSGNGTVEVGDISEPIKPGRHYLIPINTKHRITAGSEAVVLLEISLGDFDEKDIVRLDDRYGRTKHE